MIWALLSLLAALSAGASTTDGYQVVDLDLKTVQLKLYWKKPDGTAFENLPAVRDYLKAQGKTFVMATNSGIYAKDMTPLGLHIENSKTLRRLNRSHSSSGNFFINPNGVFLLSAKGPQVLSSDEFASGKTAAIDATQSGPLLIRRGKPNPRFQKGSPNKKIRSGVGVTRAGHVIFALSEEPVGFYEFAVFFRDRLHCPDALYLDGTISTLLTPTTSQVQLVPFVGIWAASTVQSGF